MPRYCNECGKELDSFDVKLCNFCIEDLRDNQDEDLGGTGHSDISWSDADEGL